MKTVAVLFARRDSIYKTIPGCDVWDEDRNALLWTGGCPVVSHPPCRLWGGLRHMSTAPVEEKELALWAVDQVQKWGGCLEHPARSTLWPAKGLPRPGEHDEFGGFTISIPQFWFGHKANKSTWVYVFGCDPKNVPTIPFVLGESPESIGGRHNLRFGMPGYKKDINKPEREHTPIAFAEWLVELARRCTVTP